MKKTRQELTTRGNSPGDVADEASSAQRRKNRRESIESFVVVFVAFLVFSLEAEGFVIPTGSMAPTPWAVTKRLSVPSAATSSRSMPTARSTPTDRARVRASEWPGEPARIAASRPALTTLPASPATASTR